jgi:hypothetical protein
MLNAAVWLGAALFCAAGVRPALISDDVQALFRDAQGAFREQYFDYLSGAVSQVIATRYFYWHIVCAIIALLHLLAEWLYLGRAAHRLWLSLLGGLLAAGLIGNALVVPKLAQLHRARHSVELRPEYRGAAAKNREAAAKSFQSWHRVFQGLNLLIIGGVAIYFWRATSPSDPLRFVTPTKFRS